MLLAASLMLAHMTSAQEDDLTTLVTSNTTFAFDLFHQLAAAQEGNLFYSPYSISQALAMTYAGAAGTTAQQMSQTLHFTLPQDKLHAQFGALAADMTSRSQATPQPGSSGQQFQLNVANALWGDKTFTFKPAFIQLLNQFYNAGLKTTDFKNAPDAARQEINDWVAQNTNDKIQNIVPSGAITLATRSVLANAIYFNASWQDPFKETDTKDDDFTLLDGSKVSVPMMNRRGSLAYRQGSGYQAVELPYFGGDMAMLIILPDEGKFASFEEALDAKAFKGVIDTLNRAEVNLSMPRFKYDFALDLSDMLKGMGMTDAFSDKADFSGIADEPLLISSILHKAYIGVDEKGTEAAAATAVVMATTAMPVPQKVIELKIDHPFIFTIYDQKTGTLLFVGRVMNPAL
jgi:serpin B